MVSYRKRNGKPKRREERKECGKSRGARKGGKRDPEGIGEANAERRRDH